MSSDIYAEPDLSKKVRYSRKVLENEEEWEEKEVDIYEKADDARPDHYRPQEGAGTQTKKHPPVEKQCFREATLALSMLCFLMLAGIIVLIIYLSLEISHLHTELLDMEANNSHLQSRYKTLNKNHSQLQDEAERLKDDRRDLEARINQLQSRYEKMNKNHSQLQNEVTRLKDKILGKWCPEGWKRSGCSCYFKLTGRKTWHESRRDCQSKGADLVIINSKEEQKFVRKLNINGESWIGLQAKQKWPSTKWEWEWVDGSPLTETFWAAGQSEYSRYQPYAACCKRQGEWMQIYNDYKNWICEK